MRWSRCGRMPRPRVIFPKHTLVRSVGVQNTVHRRDPRRATQRGVATPSRRPLKITLGSGKVGFGCLAKVSQTTRAVRGFPKHPIDRHDRTRSGRKSLSLGEIRISFLLAVPRVPAGARDDRAFPPRATQHRAPPGCTPPPPKPARISRTL